MFNTKKGRGKFEGLYDDEINKIMSRFKDWHGCIMRDEIKKLLPNIKPHGRVAFIINTQKINQENTGTLFILMQETVQSQAIQLNGTTVSEEIFRLIF